MQQAIQSAEALGLDWFEHDVEAVERLEAEAGEPPREWEFVWSTFRELSHARSAGMSPNAIAWESMIAWSTLYGIPLDHLEIDVIRRLDMLWLKVMGKAYAGLGTTESGSRQQSGDGS